MSEEKNEWDMRNIYDYSQKTAPEKINDENKSSNFTQKIETTDREVTQEQMYYARTRNARIQSKTQEEKISDKIEVQNEVENINTADNENNTVSSSEEKKITYKPLQKQPAGFDIEESHESALDELQKYKNEKKDDNGNISLQLRIDHEQLTNEIAEILQQTVSTELETAVINTVNDNLQSFSDTKEWSENIVKSLEQIQEHAEIEKSKFKEWIKKENRVTILSLATIGILFFSGFASGWCLKSKFTTYQQLIANAYNKALERELDEKWQAEQKHVREEAEKIIENARKKSEKLIEDASKKSTELQAQELKNEIQERTKSK